MKQVIWRGHIWDSKRLQENGSCWDPHCSCWVGPGCFWPALCGVWNLQQVAGLIVVRFEGGSMWITQTSIFPRHLGRVWVQDWKIRLLTKLWELPWSSLPSNLMTSLNRFLFPEIVTQTNIKHGNCQVSSKLRPTKIHQNTSSFKISRETSAKGTPSICEERSRLAPATTRGALWNLSLQGVMAVCLLHYPYLRVACTIWPNGPWNADYSDPWWRAQLVAVIWTHCGDAETGENTSELRSLYLVLRGLWSVFNWTSIWTTHVYMLHLHHATT